MRYAANSLTHGPLGPVSDHAQPFHGSDRDSDRRIRCPASRPLPLQRSQAVWSALVVPHLQPQVLRAAAAQARIGVPVYQLPLAVLAPVDLRDTKRQIFLSAA